ncbi:hypothetical protein HanIR_Chr01g0002831 [Helianthus annuus]|nr:hypothetical protein HanIR_Chr01g0002831 [Helianthus annuus]
MVTSLKICGPGLENSRRSSSWLAFPVGNIVDLTSTLSGEVESGGSSIGFDRFIVKHPVASGGIMAKD